MEGQGFHLRHLQGVGGAYNCKNVIAVQTHML